MCRERDVARFRITKSRAYAIRLSCGRFRGLGALRLKFPKSVKNAGMVGVDDIAADLSSSCKRGDRWFDGWIIGEGAQSFAQTSIRSCPSARLRSG